MRVVAFIQSLKKAEAFCLGVGKQHELPIVGDFDQNRP